MAIALQIALPALLRAMPFAAAALCWQYLAPVRAVRL